MVSFHSCGCTRGTPVRVRRPGWMRLLFPARALYQCESCGREFLLSLSEQAELGLRQQAQLRSESQPGGEEDRPRPG